LQNSLSLEYALHSLVLLALLPEGQTLTIKQLASIQNVTPTYLAKVFTQLGKGNLVRTSVGSKGGVSLARPAGEITFYHVFLAINGRTHMFQCANIRSRSVAYVPQPGMCEIHRTMWEAEEKMFAHLRNVTIQDIAMQVIDKQNLGDEQTRLALLRQLLQKEADTS
jgi:Rrf2 family protein